MIDSADTVSLSQGGVPLTPRLDGAPALSIADAAVDEGSTASVEVSLSRTASLPVTVDLATEDGTAGAPADYTAGAGTLTLAPGERSAEIEVQTIADGASEGTETFRVSLSNSLDATIAGGEAVVTIRDADGGGGGGGGGSGGDQTPPPGGAPPPPGGDSRGQTPSAGPGRRAECSDHPTLGTRGTESLIGTIGRDLIRAFKGSDTLRGRGGNDRLEGGRGHDYLYGGRGSDEVRGGSGRDRLRCGPGDDVAYAGKGDRVGRDCERVRRVG